MSNPPTAVGSTCFFRPSVAVLYNFSVKVYMIVVSYTPNDNLSPWKFPGDIRHLWTYTYHQYYIARAVFLLRFSVTNRRMRLSLFFCALYTPHHIYKSFPTYYDHHVNCPLLSVDVRIMHMSSVEQPARRMDSLRCSQDVWRKFIMCHLDCVPFFWGGHYPEQNRVRGLWVGRTAVLPYCCRVPYYCTTVVQHQEFVSAVVVVVHTPRDVVASF